MCALHFTKDRIMKTNMNEEIPKCCDYCLALFTANKTIGKTLRYEVSGWFGL